MYQIHFEMIKYAYSRSTYRTAKDLVKALEKVGAKPFIEHPGRMILQVKEQCATREEALTRRKQIERALQYVSVRGRAPAYLFTCTEL